MIFVFIADFEFIEWSNSPGQIISAWRSIYTEKIPFFIELMSQMIAIISIISSAASNDQM